MGNTILKLSDYKMNCSDIENLANDYVDNELAEVISFAVRKHAGECLTCSDVLSEISQITQWASNLGDIPVPSDVSMRLRDKLRSL